MKLSGSLIPSLQGAVGASAPLEWLVVIVVADFCILLPLSPDWFGGRVITRFPQLPVRVLLASVLPQALR